MFLRIKHKGFIMLLYTGDQNRLQDDMSTQHAAAVSDKESNNIDMDNKATIGLVLKKCVVISFL